MFKGTVAPRLDRPENGKVGLAFTRIRIADGKRNFLTSLLFFYFLLEFSPNSRILQANLQAALVGKYYSYK